MRWGWEVKKGQCIYLWRANGSTEFGNGVKYGASHQPWRDRPIMARPSVEQGQRTDEGRGLVPSRRWVEAEGQVFAPMTPILFGEPGAPGREGGKRIPHRFEARPPGQMETALPGNNIDFLDFVIL